MEDFVKVEGDVDPAAEFLAREQSALAELEEDFDYHKVNSTDKVNGETNGLELNGPSSENEILDENQSTGKLGSSSQQSVSPQPDKPEPEKIRKWREDQKILLEEKDREEAKKKEELRSQAKRELDEWYSRYKEQLEKSKLNNRNAEKEWIAERDAETPGQEWEKIARMCDFNPKAARNTKDTSRMRSILLQLKQSPPPPTK